MTRASSSGPNAMRTGTRTKRYARYPRIRIPMADHATRPARTRPDRSGSELRVDASVRLRPHRKHHPHAHPLSLERGDGNLIDQPPDDRERQHPVEWQLVGVDLSGTSLHRALHAG